MNPLAFVLLSVAVATPTMAQDRVLPPLPSEEAPAIHAEVEANTLVVGSKAWSLFRHAWGTGDWEPFLAMTSDEFQFWFPQGPFAGLHEGAAGKRMLTEWAASHAGQDNRIESYAETVTVGGNLYIVESTAQGMPDSPAAAYRNLEVIVFRIDGSQVTALREYWNVLAPGE